MGGSRKSYKLPETEVENLLQDFFYMNGLPNVKMSHARNHELVWFSNEFFPLKICAKRWPVTGHIRKLPSPVSLTVQKTRKRKRIHGSLIMLTYKQFIPDSLIESKTLTCLILTIDFSEASIPTLLLSSDDTTEASYSFFEQDHIISWYEACSVDCLMITCPSMTGYARTCSVLILPVDIFSRLTINLLLFLSSFPSSGARLQFLSLLEPSLCIVFAALLLDSSNITILLRIIVFTSQKVGFCYSRISISYDLLRENSRNQLAHTHYVHDIKTQMLTGTVVARCHLTDHFPSFTYCG